MHCEIYSVLELHEKMLKFKKCEYSLKAPHDNLKSHYEKHFCFVKVEGCQAELVCFKNICQLQLKS